MTKIYKQMVYSTSKFLALKNIFLILSGVTSIFIVRFLGPQEYGKWSLVYQLVGTCSAVVNLGFLMTLAKFIPEFKDMDQRNRLLSQAFVIVSLVFVFFVFIYSTGMTFIPSSFPKEIKDLKYSFCFFVGALSILNVIEGFYRGIGRFNIWTVIDGSRSMFSAGLAFFLILYLVPEYTNVFYSYYFTIVLFLVFLLIALRKNIVFSLPVSPGPEIMKFAVILLAGQFVYLFGSSIDSILLRALLKDTAQVGYYNAGIKLPKIIETMLITPLGVPFLYYFSHHETLQNREKLLEFGVKILGIVSCFIALLLFSFAEEIILLLFGSSYLPSVPVLRIFSFVVAIQGFTILFSQYFIAINKPLISIIIGFVTICIFSILNLALIPHFKATGSCISTVTGLLISTTIILHMLGKFNVKCFRTFFLLVAIVTVSALAGLYINSFTVLPLFILCVFLTRIISMQDFRTLRRILAKS